MSQPQPSAPLRVERDRRGVVSVTLDRPERRNALDAELITGLRRTFQDLAADDEARAVVLTGAGRVFCAGADVDWLRRIADQPFESNLADSRAFETMLRSIHDCPHPVVARVNGHALGGGIGLIGCVDVAVAVRGALFAFPEVRLGVAPAVISPYVLAKIGLANARHLFLTGERFDGDRAREIGLVTLHVEPDQLDATMESVVAALLAGAPKAQANIKALVQKVFHARNLDEAAEHTVGTIARLRLSDEAQEGMAAFLDKREPSWAEGAGVE